MATNGACTITEVTFGSMKSATFAWTAGADGGVSGFFTSAMFDGEVCAVTSVPGSPAPTSYTLTILDNNGLDILLGSGVTRSATLSESLTKPGGAVASSKLQLVVAGAGAGTGAKGMVYVFIR